jgi:ribosomal protein S18 acetylase RimI-like enzyme
MTSSTPLVFRRQESAGARVVRDTVEEIYRDSYSEQQQADPFSASGRWMGRFEVYTTEPGFDLVIACTSDGKPAGQAFGWQLGPATKWWDGLVAEPEPGFTREDGTRTFALSEIMVRRAYTGQGIAHALHDELLGGRSEERATLLVRPANTFAYRAYTRWGWQKVAQLRPGWPDSPLFDVLILPLPVR